MRIPYPDFVPSLGKIYYLTREIYFSINTRKNAGARGHHNTIKIFYLLIIIALMWIVRKYLCDNRKVSVRLPSCRVETWKQGNVESGQYSKPQSKGARDESPSLFATKIGISLSHVRDWYAKIKNRCYTFAA